VKNVENKYYGKIDISPTGPILLGYYYFNKYNVNYKNFDLGFCIDNNHIFHFKQKKFILKKYDEYKYDNPQSSSYIILWAKRKIYDTN
jgi:hypothetical protein